MISYFAISNENNYFKMDEIYLRLSNKLLFAKYEGYFGYIQNFIFFLQKVYPFSSKLARKGETAQLALKKNEHLFAKC